tara:strand:+ start:130 stop:528 length:399 start_codon:yes stop_codon:yes gene_type:complete
MDKKYLSKIIAKDDQGLKLISAYCFEAKVKIGEIKYLRKNQIFLVFLKRFSLENFKEKKEINSICKFEFVENVKSKNIDQSDENLVLELIAIDLLKNNDKYEINLIFSNNSCITLSTEIVETTLEDQKNLDD